MFLLVSKIKMIRMILYVVHGQVQKSYQQHNITKESNRFLNQSTLITIWPKEKLIWCTEDFLGTELILISSRIYALMFKLLLISWTSPCQMNSSVALQSSAPSRACRKIWQVTQSTKKKIVQLCYERAWSEIGRPTSLQSWMRDLIKRCCQNWKEPD